MIRVADHAAGVRPTNGCLRQRFRKRCLFAPVATSVACPAAPGEFLSCEEKLLDARRALHMLVTGGKVQYVSHDGRTASYTAANRGDLERYILTLEAECGRTSAPGCGCGACGPRRARGRAMSVSWYA